MNILPIHPQLQNISKKVRNLNKKVRDIEQLQKLENKTQSQQEKIKQKKQIQEQIKELEEQEKQFKDIDQPYQLEIKKLLKQQQEMFINLLKIKDYKGDDELSKQLKNVFEGKNVKALKKLVEDESLVQAIQQALKGQSSQQQQVKQEQKEEEEQIIQQKVEQKEVETKQEVVEVTETKQDWVGMAEEEDLEKDKEMIQDILRKQSSKGVDSDFIQVKQKLDIVNDKKYNSHKNKNYQNRDRKGANRENRENRVNYNEKRYD